MCESVFKTAWEQHVNGMVCVNRSLKQHGNGMVCVNRSLKRHGNGMVCVNPPETRIPEAALQPSRLPSAHKVKYAFTRTSHSMSVSRVHQKSGRCDISVFCNQNCVLNSVQDCSTFQ
jgi:hypothetical protein